MLGLQEYAAAGKTEATLKKTLRALRDSEARLRSIFSSMSDMVFVFDKDQRFTFCHALEKDKLYAPPKNFIGKRLSELMPPDICRTFTVAFEENKKGKDSQFDYSLSIKGKTFWFCAKMSPLMSEGKFVGSVATVRDITERIRSAENLRKKTEDIEKFNKFAVGRELKMIELKKKISKLEEEAGKRKIKNADRSRK
ncbi:MAG: PAS domain S-box protein [Nanoarchaeota archaeon]|nr:PAS domain S-box protein [Nanoarchaeota archaeon]